MTMTRRAAAGAFSLAALALAGGAARGARSRPSGSEMRARFIRYVEQFNSGRHEGLVPFYAPGVVLYLPGRELVGPDAIVAHYRRSFGFLTEWLRIDSLIADENGLAAELYTRFSAHRDYPEFKARPLRAGDVYVVTTFALFDFDDAGRFTRIRPALWHRDLSGVRGQEGDGD